MCGRFTTLEWDEVLEVARALETGAAINLSPDWPARASGCAPEAFPGQKVAIAVRDGNRPLEARLLTWGFPLSSSGKLVFNTRCEKAAASPMWHRAFEQGRCVIAAHAFCEAHRSEIGRAPSGARRRQVYRFAPKRGLVLMAGIWQKDRFSLLTCEPDEQVAHVHDRMPLLLSEETAQAWTLGAAPDECRVRPALSAEAIYAPDDPSEDAQLSLF